MDFKGIENLSEEEILELYSDVIETPTNLAYEVCPPGMGTGVYETVYNPTYGTGTRREICK